MLWGHLSTDEANEADAEQAEEAGLCLAYQI